MPPTLLKEDGIVHDDPWRPVDDETPLSAEAPALVSLSRWLAERDALRSRAAPLGVRLCGGDDASALADALERLALITLEFTPFNDGRGYSQARLLRERFGYRGELRAVGEVYRDQLGFMARCGIDSFLLAEDEDAHAALERLRQERAR